VALSSTEINVIKLDSAIRLGAFGGVNNSNDRVYLGIGANGTVGGRIQIPENIRAIGGLGVDVANINLIVGGQTTFPIRNVSVEEGMKQAFENVDVYISAMAYVGNWLANARVWVLVPQIVETDFRKGGWDVEVKVFGYLPEWNWEDKGVTPVVQGMLLEDSGEDILEIYTEEAAEPSAAMQEAIEQETVMPEATTEGNGETATETPSGTPAVESTGQEEAMQENTSETKTEAQEETQESEEETTVSGNTAGTETEEVPVSEEDVEDVSKRPIRKAPAPRNGGRTQAEITVDGGEGKTPYILLAFDGTVTEENIKNNLKMKKDSSDININWTEEGKDPTDPDAEINATIIANMKKSEDDGKVYHLALMRLKNGGTYSVSAENGLSFTDEKGIAVEPFEELSLNLDSSKKELSGKVKHPAGNTTYVLRTYFAKTKGGADYLIDERQIDAPDNISVSIPTYGALAPTGSYYVTSFLMMEKTADLDGDGVDETKRAETSEDEIDEEDESNDEETLANLRGITSAILNGTSIRNNAFVQECLQNDFYISTMGYRYENIKEKIEVVMEINFKYDDLKVDICRTYEFDTDIVEMRQHPLMLNRQEKILEMFQKAAYKHYYALLDKQKKQILESHIG